MTKVRLIDHPLRQPELDNFVKKLPLQKEKYAYFLVSESCFGPVMNLLGIISYKYACLSLLLDGLA